MKKVRFTRDCEVDGNHFYKNQMFELIDTRDGDYVINVGGKGLDSWDWEDNYNDNPENRGKKCWSLYRCRDVEIVKNEFNCKYECPECKKKCDLWESE